MVEFLIQTKFENHIECDHVVREFTWLCIDWLLVTNIDFYLTWASEWYFGLHDWQLAGGVNNWVCGPLFHETLPVHLVEILY